MDYDYSSGILVTVKKMLGLESDYTPYDLDLVIFINSALMVLSQIGVGPSGGFHITGYDETWADLVGDDQTKLEAVKSYVYLKTRLSFDPPANSFVVTSIENQVKELEWRLNVRTEEV